MGEPLNDEAWKWYHNVVGEGKCTVVDTWWQTGKSCDCHVTVGYCIITIETGGIMITPRPSPNNITPKPGFPMRPFFGIDPVLMNEEV